MTAIILDERIRPRQQKKIRTVQNEYCDPGTELGTGESNGIYQESRPRKTEIIVRFDTRDDEGLSGGGWLAVGVPLLSRTNLKPVPRLSCLGRLSESLEPRDSGLSFCTTNSR